MTKPLKAAIAWLTLLSCLPTSRSTAQEDHNFFTVPPYVFRGTPDPRDLLADEPAGFCFARTADDRAYLIVSFRKAVRTIDEMEEALDKLAKDLRLAVGAFNCPSEVPGRALGELLAESGKELVPFVVPEELFGARPQQPPAERSSPPKTKWPIAEYDGDAATKGAQR
jgi:hypothetical protein